MVTEKRTTDRTAEIAAIGSVYAALKELEPVTQARVLRYSAEMLGIELNNSTPNEKDDNRREEPPSVRDQISTPLAAPSPDTPLPEEHEGISGVALKWMKRSGLDAKGLQELFSLGIDEIDLVAKKVPGTGKKERMRNVLLLKGIAAYLGTGVARISHEQLKEASLHYNAYDATNFATYLKACAPDVTGSKETGFTLTARGITSGTELVKELLSPSAK